MQSEQVGQLRYPGMFSPDQATSKLSYNPTYKEA